MLQNTKLCFYFVILSFPYHLEAAPDCEQWIAKLVSEQGRVEKQRSNQSDWQQVKKNETFCQGDKIRTRKRSRVTLEFGNEALVTLEQRSTLIFPIVDKGAFSWILELFQGAAFFRSRSPHQLKINTPFINAVHEGTEFMVAVNEQQTEISVFDGRVAAENQTGRVQINKGQVGITTKDQITQVQALTIHPKDAVQWALYYPPIVDYQKLASILTVPGIQKSITHYQQGDVFQALQVLDQIPKQRQDEHYIALKASLLLTVGNVEEALLEINQAEQHLETELSTGLAIKTIIAVSKNQTELASELALKATEINPESAVAKIALSYVYQAKFKIDEALATTEQATQLTPENALAWARLAELQLSAGDRSGALESAQKAQSLNPQLGRTQTILGFANLAQIDIEQAKTAFNQAINLNSADPLARLGLGLAKIRKGAIKEGTRDLETAVSLDPDNSIMRSYLGKAYYELRNEGYAATELAIAKEMDPNDPTPWFYDAILKQTTSRPVEALHDMQKAIELNDNRGVYRSKLLLDEDAAARSVSLARIYQDLRFDQLAINESSKSLAIDPANFSAHRFLSDTFSFQQRVETSRVSELLQAQLLQPINTNPVQPQSPETGLNILFGTSPSETGFNEFTPLFERDGTQFLGFGAVGNNGTHADQAVLSGIYKNLSYSLGQFHYETEGFRENNELRHNLYNFFVQTSLTPNLDIQLEYRRRETDKGDLKLNFDPNSFSKSLNTHIDSHTPRIGIHYSPNPHSHFILSAMYRDRVEKETELRSSGTSSIRDVDDRHGYDIQAQYLYKRSVFNIVFGLNTYNFNGARETKIVEDQTDNLLFRTHEDRSGRWYDGYIYSSINYPNRFFWTLGLSIVSFKDDQDQLINFDRVLPKIGVQWHITDKIQLRAAAMKTVKRSLVFEETLEPTQIAGFNQFFDDFNGTIAQRFGVGIDVNFTKSLAGGIELSRRNTDVPRIFQQNEFIDPNNPPEGRANSIFKFESQREDLYRGYLYWKGDSNWSVLSEYRLERFRRNPSEVQSIGIAEPELPKEVWTTTIPLTIRYFNANGFFCISRCYLCPPKSGRCSGYTI